VNEIRYLLDENVDPLIRKELVKKEPTLIVWKIGDPGPVLKVHPMKKFYYGVKKIHSFLVNTVGAQHAAPLPLGIVTNNRKSMPGHLKTHLAKRSTRSGYF